MNLILVGMMGAGKSTVGRALAGRLSRPFVDTDEAIAAAAGCSIPEIFAREGEETFRRLESETLGRILTAPAPQVVATGGGAVLSPRNRQAMRAHGCVIWLDAPPAELYARAAADGVAVRPLIDGPDPLDRLTQLSQARHPLYREAAHVRMETAGKRPETVVIEILTYLQEGC